MRLLIEVLYQATRVSYPPMAPSILAPSFRDEGRLQSEQDGRSLAASTNAGARATGLRGRLVPPTA